MSRYLLSRFDGSLLIAAGLMILAPACSTPPPPPPPPSAPTAPTAPSGPTGSSGLHPVLNPTQVSYERAPSPKVSVKDAMGNRHDYTYTDGNVAAAAFVFSGIDGVTWEKPGGLAPEYLQMVVAAPNAGRIVPATAGASAPLLNAYDDTTHTLRMAGVIGDRPVADQTQASGLAQALAAASLLPGTTTAARLKWVEDTAAETITVTFRLN